MLFFHILIGLVIGLAAFINAVPLSQDGTQPLNSTSGLNMSDSDLATTLGYDPSYDYHGYSTVQAWMGKKMVTVGSMTGDQLYKTVASLLHKNCRSTGGWGQCGGHPTNAEFQSKCMLQWPGKTTTCTTGIWKISAQWQNENIRRLLIDAVAGSLGAVTLQSAAGRTNCFDMAGTKGCNVGDVVRVNFPTWGDQGYNYMHINLWNYYTGYGSYDCCAADGRHRMDNVLDLMGDDIRKEFDGWKDKVFSRDSLCIINGYTICP